MEASNNTQNKDDSVFKRLFYTSLHHVFYLIFVAILSVIAVDKIEEVFVLQGICSEGKVHVRPEVVYPEPICPRRFAGGLAVKEKDIRLDALCVEYACGQPQESVDVTLVKQFLGLQIKEKEVNQE